MTDHFHYLYSNYANLLAEAGDLPPELRPKLIPAAELRHSIGDEIGLIVVGDPDQVAERLHRLRREVRMTHLVMGMSLPGLHPDQSRSSMKLFAREVMPKLR